MNLIVILIYIYNHYFNLAKFNKNTIIALFLIYYLTCFFIFIYYEFKFLSFATDFPEYINSLYQKKIILKQKQLYLHYLLDYSFNFFPENQTFIEATDTHLSALTKRFLNFIFSPLIYLGLMKPRIISFLSKNDKINLDSYRKIVKEMIYTVKIQRRIYNDLHSLLLNFDIFINEVVF